MNVEIAATRFQRWKDFAIRMAKTCFKKRQSPCQEWILSRVQDFFEYAEVKEYHQYFVSWDYSEKLPNGGSPGYVCDHVSSMFDEVWREVEQYATPKEDRLLDAFWDREQLDDYDELREKIVDRYESPIHSCIRAGMDLAYSPSAGVLGFTVGDIKQMYPEGVPEWITSEWQKPNGEAVDFNDMPNSAELLL